MPTAGRLSGAIFFGILGGILAFLLIPYFSDAGPPSLWYPLCGAVGVLVGWMFVGPRTGQGLGPAIGTGLTGGVALAFWVLFVLSLKDMIVVSMRGRYAGPIEALVDVFAILSDYAQQFYSPLNAGVVVGGGIIAGLLTDAIGSRYR